MPLLTSRSRSRFVAEMTRTLTLRVRGLADAPDLALLERAQELRLHADRELADLVEEHRAAVGRFERADAIAIGAGERAAHVTEELALDEVRRDRAAVDDDERLVGARAALHDLGGDELLAGAVLAVDEAVDVARRDLLEEREELAHRPAGAGERAEARHHRHERLARRARSATMRITDCPSESTASGGSTAPRMRSSWRRVPFSEPESSMRQPAAIRDDAAVEARDRRIVEHEIVRRRAFRCGTRRPRARAFARRPCPLRARR